MKQGFKVWPRFFREWFEYCDRVLQGEEELSYEKLRGMIQKSESIFSLKGGTTDQSADTPGEESIKSRLRKRKRATAQ